MVTVSVKLEEEQTTTTYTETTFSNTPPLVSVPEPSSSTSAPTPMLSQPTNFLTIVREKNNSIKGGYSIDPSMPMPPGAVPSIGDDGKLLNMRAATKNASIDLVVEIARSGDAQGPTRLQADSRNGSVTVTVHDRRQTRFRLKVTSKNGTIKICVPTTYSGTVSTWVKNANLLFGPSVQARLTPFYEQDVEARFFIGDYPSSGYEGDETWLGDHLHVESENAKVWVDFVGEESSQSKGSSTGTKSFKRR